MSPKTQSGLFVLLILTSLRVRAQLLPEHPILPPRVESLDAQKGCALKTKDMRNRPSFTLCTAFIDFRGPKALNDTPRCDDGSHLRAMCEPCHLIYDLRCRQRALCGEDAVKWALQQGQN